jgi:two-component system, OmpR family, response regulator ChvI
MKREKPAKRNVLVVDDERDVCLTIKEVLEGYGFDVDSYHDPTMALENFRANLYELLILDIKMPKMNGFELFQEVKKIDDKVKICFLTALSELKEYKAIIRRVCPKLDERYIIKKPIENEVLVRQLNQILLL